MTEAKVVRMSSIPLTSGFQQKTEKMKMNHRGKNLNQLKFRFLTKSMKLDHSHLGAATSLPKSITWIASAEQVKI